MSKNKMRVSFLIIFQVKSRFEELIMKSIIEIHFPSRRKVSNGSKVQKGEGYETTKKFKGMNFPIPKRNCSQQHVGIKDMSIMRE
ncbi:hypothetical protein Fmac_006105 [Flemingia macrophylla]|uniref:Uncharacterized protein n=1 Tax=Flemingia macrophylla TaxID=520843 RepID=A0ABD1N9R5_9FABA